MGLPAPSASLRVIKKAGTETTDTDEEGDIAVLINDGKTPFVGLFDGHLGGHYVDTGATKLLAEGKFSSRADMEPRSYTRSGLRLSDGTRLDADAVIWCTGYTDKDARETVADIMNIALPVDATWGVDEEGEIRGMWKRHSKVDNYWFMGGFTQQHRWYSRTLAQQIKASLEGVLPPPYLDLQNGRGERA
jgi:hypothetical protein